MATDLSQNPLCSPSGLPYDAYDWSKIKFDHYRPAITEGMRVELEEIKAITANTEAPTFTNTILAMELSGDLFDRATSAFNNIALTDSTDAIMELESELAPLLSQHSDNIYLNEALFKRVDAVFNEYSADPAGFKTKNQLTPDDIRLLTETHKGFVLAGAKLNDADKSTMRQYNETLSSLENDFSQNLMKIDDTNGVVIDDVALLDGLTQDEIDNAASIAKERGLEGKFVLNLVNTSRNPLLLKLKNRSVRQQLFQCSTQRALTGDHNNVDVVYDTITTRAKVAQLLGYKTFADFQLVQEMAATPAKALAMLTSMVPNVLNNLRREAEDILVKLQAELGPDASLEAHDWEYYAEKVRADKYNVDPAVIREYFVQENVVKDGLFRTMNRLFGIDFKERTDIPVYHPDVKTYEIFEESGEPIALIYLDYFKRKGKSGGAWMSDHRSPNAQRSQKSVVANVMNVVKNPNGPSYCSLDEASTTFHELGHLLHSVFSYKIVHRSLASTNVSTDYVEFPSTTLEDYSIDPSVISHYAKHAQTGELLPKAELDRVLASTKFNLGFETYEYLAAAIVDLEWHSLTLQQIEDIFAKYPTKAEAIEAYEVEILKKHNAFVDYAPPRYKTQYFNHSMTSYSARYYAYMWSEILAADAFRYITQLSERPGITRENGDNIRQNCYATGNTRDLMEGYIAFRGSAPTTDALLLRRGLSVEGQTQ